MNKTLKDFGKPEYKCEECGETFIYNINFIKHKKEHSEELKRNKQTKNNKE